MTKLHDGEIQLKEKYGSSSHEIVYVKPPEQATVVILDEKKSSDVSDWFAKIFLPHGYPNSVSGDYIAYQVWDTAQAFCSTITGILATQEVLRGVGVGDTNATPLAATVTWVIKDGCGHLGKIMFAFTHGTYLDAYSKKWRLYADTLNDAAMCIEIALPLFKNYTTFVLCISTVMKAIVGVAGGATRAAMTQHHAIRGNMADVSAKDAAQETAVNLFASLTALLIITIFGNSLIIFLLMMVLHIVFNYLAVRAVCLRTLNEPRFLQLIDLYLKKEIIATPCEINRNEPIIFYHLGPYLLDLKLCGFQIKIGHSMKNLIQLNAKTIPLKKIRAIYEDRNYILLPNVYERAMYIFVKEGITTDNLLCAYFHAVLLSILTSAINEEPLAIYNDTNDGPFPQLCHSLRSATWAREAVEYQSLCGFSYDPSIELMKYLNNIVRKEWGRIRDAIGFIGWDLSKHLLIVDEWRICNDRKIKKKLIIPEQSARKTKTVSADTDKSVRDDEYDDANSDDILTKMGQYTIEPEITVHNKESGKLKLERLPEMSAFEPRSLQVPDEPNDTIETFATKADSDAKRQKKKD